jgi:hypothetical protein
MGVCVTMLDEMAGYQQAELDEIQRRWALRFPPDLIALLLRRRPLVAGGFDWLEASDTEIESWLQWPLEGFVFDVVENDLWWPGWGSKPMEPSAKIARLTMILDAAPKLIPLYEHRYLPEQPFECGNPVFSVYQSDIICCGASIDDWLVREERGWHGALTNGADTSFKEIPFWSEAVRQNV